MIINFRDYFKTIGASLFDAENTPARLSGKRWVVIIFLFLIYPVWVLYLGLGNLLDEILFPGYRDQEVSEPIFIIGNFRSGTTFLHRLLLRDERFTGTRTWEIYFAPSITYRKVINRVRKISRTLGSPIRWIVNRFDRSLNDYSYMHKTGMRQFEEDSHFFYHIWTSYNLFALFPFPELFRKYIHYDQRVPQERRSLEISYYHSLIKRHIHYHQGKRYISKNPDFSPMVETILEEFPDARFINIVRDPRDMVPSTINMWANHWHTFGSPREDYPLQEVLLEHMEHYYRYPHQVLGDLPPDRYAVIHFADFVTNPEQVIGDLYDQFGLTVSPDYRKILQEETIRSRSYQSNHDYSLSEMGLEEEEIARRFLPALRNYPFSRQLVEPVRKPIGG